MTMRAGVLDYAGDLEVAEVDQGLLVRQGGQGYVARN